jgi:hypothetical protein
VIGVAMCGRECERWVYERILRDAGRQPKTVARPSGLTYRRLPSANDKCLLNSFLNVGNNSLLRDITASTYPLDVLETSTYTRKGQIS